MLSLNAVLCYTQDTHIQLEIFQDSLYSYSFQHFFSRKLSPLHLFFISYISSSSSSWLDDGIGFPLPICPYHPSLSACLPDYIFCPHRAVVCKFLLVGQYWHIHVKGSLGEHHLWAHPCFSSSVPPILFVLLR